MIVSSLFRCHPSSIIGLMSWLDDTISRAVHTYTTQPFIHCMYTLYGGPNKDFFLPYIYTRRYGLNRTGILTVSWL